MGFLDEAKKFAKGHKSEVDKALTEAAKVAEERTGGKFDKEIREGQSLTEKELGTNESGRAEGREGHEGHEEERRR